MDCFATSSLPAGESSRGKIHALALLDRIEQNPAESPLLAWVSLMNGGQTLETARRWRDLAEREPDETLRKTLGSLVLTFSELTDSKQVWAEALEGFAMRESTFVREMRTEGRQEGRLEGRVEARREDLLRVLRSRFPDAVPQELAAHIQQQTDLDELSRWFDLALSAASLDAFRTAIGR